MLDEKYLDFLREKQRQLRFKSVSETINYIIRQTRLMEKIATATTEADIQEEENTTPLDRLAKKYGIKPLGDGEK